MDVVYGEGELDEGYLKPVKDYLETTGKTNERVISFDFLLNGTYINPESIVIEYEYNQIQETIFNDTYSANFVIGEANNNRWLAEGRFLNSNYHADSINDTGDSVLNQLFGIKLISVSYQGKTYTDFNWI